MVESRGNMVCGVRMEEQKIRDAFSGGLSLSGGIFQPLLYLSRVDEPDFGCEGRPEGKKIYGRAYGRDAAGPRLWDLEEADLWRGGFDDGMWVGLWQGGYATLAGNSTQPKPLSEALFQRVFGNCDGGNGI